MQQALCLQPPQQDCYNVYQLDDVTRPHTVQFCICPEPNVQTEYQIDHIVNSSEYNIEKMYKPREPGCGPVVKSLVVAFQAKSKRDLVLETLKKEKVTLNTRNISAQNPPLQVFVNEYLTPYMKRLFYEAKKIKGDKNYKYLWVKNGQILLKKTTECRPMRLISLDDLAKI